MPQQSKKPIRIKTALVVDDAPGIRLTIKSYLEPEGFDVLQADNAETALRFCKEQRIDVIILDMMLPGSMMGPDILQKVRGRSATSRTPIITMSGLPAYEDGLQTIDPKVVFLPKPFDKEKFMQTLQSVL